VLLDWTGSPKTATGKMNLPELFVNPAIAGAGAREAADVGGVHGLRDSASSLSDVDETNASKQRYSRKNQRQKIGRLLSAQRSKHVSERRYLVYERAHSCGNQNSADDGSCLPKGSVLHSRFLAQGGWVRVACSPLPRNITPLLA
jgi:hypothetical protein